MEKLLPFAKKKNRLDYRMLEGKKCRFRDINWKEGGDYPFLRELFDEPETGEAIMTDGSVLNTQGRVYAWINTNHAMETWNWIIEDSHGNAIGLAMIESVRLKYRSAGPWVVWLQSNHRNKGFEIDAHFVLFRFGFDNLNLHKIWTEASETDQQHSENFIKLFPWVSIEGTLRDEILFNGRWHSLRRFAVFEDMIQWKIYFD